MVCILFYTSKIFNGYTSNFAKISHSFAFDIHFFLCKIRLKDRHNFNWLWVYWPKVTRKICQQIDEFVLVLNFKFQKSINIHIPRQICPQMHKFVIFWDLKCENGQLRRKNVFIRAWALKSWELKNFGTMKLEIQVVF